MKLSISSARDWSKIGPACRSQLLSARLVQRIAGWLPCASRVAMSHAVSMSFTPGTHRLTRPIRSASLPSRKSDVSR